MADTSPTTTIHGVRIRAVTYLCGEYNRPIIMRLRQIMGIPASAPGWWRHSCQNAATMAVFVTDGRLGLACLFARSSLGDILIREVAPGPKATQHQQVVAWATLQSLFESLAAQGKAEAVFLKVPRSQDAQWQTVLQASGYRPGTPLYLPEQGVVRFWTLKLKGASTRKE